MLGHELVGYIPGVAGVDYGTHDRGIVQLLGLVDFVTPWIAARVVVSNVILVRSNRTDHIAFHDLRMVDVIEYLDVRGE